MLKTGHSLVVYGISYIEKKGVRESRLVMRIAQYDIRHTQYDIRTMNSLGMLAKGWDIVKFDRDWQILYFE